MTSESYEDRMAKYASTYSRQAVNVVIYGSAKSLEKRQTIKSRIETEASEVTVHLLDEKDFERTGVLLGEMSFADHADCNIFLVDPDWDAFSMFHEFRDLLTLTNLHSAIVLFSGFGSTGDDRQHLHREDGAGELAYPGGASPYTELPNCFVANLHGRHSVLPSCDQT